jgi:transposase-like protein
VLCVGSYLRHSASYRDLEEMMAQRGLSVDHSTITPWVLRYAPIPKGRVPRRLRHPNRSWRVDEAYLRIAGKWTYLYRALDSEGNTYRLHALCLPRPNHCQAFLQLAFCRGGHVRPRVINVDGHPAYPSVITELMQTRELSKVGRCRPSS